MTSTQTTAREIDRSGEPVLSARGLVKTFGRVIGLDGVDVDLWPGEVLAVIGDNGAGKSTLIKALTGALEPDAGELRLDGKPVVFRRPQDARDSGIETVYQTLAVAPALDIASNLYLAREERRPGLLGSVFRMLDHKGMRERALKSVQDLGITTIQNMSVPVDRRARRTRDRAGAAPRRAAARAWPGRDPDQPQHAQRLGGGRPDPRPAARWVRRCDHAAEPHPDRGRGDHDRGDDALSALTTT